MNIPSFFSIIFSMACAVYLFIGIYALYLHSNSRTNRLFFALALALSFWSFGFCMAVNAGNLNAVLFWRRFSAIGFGSFFSILLHFFLVFTSHDFSVKKRFYALLYLPTLIVFLGFTYIPSLNPDQYHMILTPLGWINIAVNNAWDQFFTAYYLLYSICGLILIWRWGRTSGNLKNKRISRLIVISFITTMLLGSVTDNIGILILDVHIPQLVPILMLFPALVIYYSIKKYGFLNPKLMDLDASLMSDQIRSKTINYLSNAFLFATFLNIVASYLLTDNTDLSKVLVFSCLLLFIGIVLQAIQRSLKRKALKDILNTIVLSMIVPLFTFRYIHSASVTIWAFPAILLIVTLVFDSSFIQIILSVTILLTQAIVWVLIPEVTLTIDNSDHAFRLGIFIIAIWFAHFVRRIYQTKLRENADQIDFQKSITEISTEFINVTEQNVEDKISSALSRLGNLMKLDRAYFFVFNDKKESLSCLGLWFDHNKLSEGSIDKQISTDQYLQLISCIKEGNTIISFDLSNDQSETCDELLRLLGSLNKSFVAIPVINKNDVYGFFGIDADPKTSKWPETQLALLRITSNILAVALERIQQEKEIKQMAYYDYLTSLPNRTLFKDYTQQEIRLAELSNKMFAVVFMDIDDFKAVNDTIGHDGGDQLLVMVTEQLKKFMGESNIVSRFGGDEFLILLKAPASIDEIRSITQKMLGIFEKPFILNEQEFFVSSSAGIAVYPYDGSDPDTLIKNADLAMYKSKKQGKNRYYFCTEALKEEVLKNIKLTSNLFRVLERQELQLYYQPQVNTETKEIICAEALLRWFHPSVGMISPGLFIPLAEKTGLIIPIGDWVLKTACLQCHTWHKKGLPGIRIAVNVSILQLRHPDFVNRVGQILEEVQLEPQFLEIEITESTAVGESDYIIETLEKLKMLGVTISIDDFGTQYSSLSRLCTMPIDRIKLDMQFVRAIGRSDKENAIIKGIIDLAHTLGIKVVAEGVETELQYHFLTECQCDKIQGYYFYRPLPQEELDQILF